jgi:multiple sugar transport system substrate-binding protein
MGQILGGIRRLRRRELLVAAASAAALSGRQGAAQDAGPWAMTPKSKVDKLNFVVWTYGAQPSPHFG